MKYTSLDFLAESVSIEACDGRSVRVACSITDSIAEELIQELGIDIAVNTIGVESILDHIGIDKVKKYFDLIASE